LIESTPEVSLIGLSQREVSSSGDSLKLNIVCGQENLEKKAFKQ
jgi:hypothetical protein